MYFYYLGGLDRKVNYLNGQLNGPYLKNYDNGKVNVSGEFSNGLKTGHWTWYTNVGTIDMSGDFVDGLQDGYWEYYYPVIRCILKVRDISKPDCETENGCFTIKTAQSGEKVRTKMIWKPDIGLPV
ncbi:MAG: hypothetical protein IPM74_19480 [Crocinitomicaceae bacterium]|nr:hypothetical protein [Crocinitomicaceae bacterium]